VSEPDFNQEDYDNFLKEIAEEMVRIFKISTEEATRRVKEWDDRYCEDHPGGRVNAPYGWLIFHEAPEHWAQVLYTGNWTYWRKDELD